ncbi:Restriction endonuclease [Flexibacter flexilis DSM 6793]|uniref:Restriction endonuclease n=1 Tax=Flexibacter flexilis DSM 6793 TaxID=927664 RepID=A0A1I1EAD4_9BACT|nr:restriction endonuclease [Flexibacter flexilis]SFB82318.1 Restriction endonuclease [Flexibacter flexilis DSM 6793]
MKIEEKDWRKYERSIYGALSNAFDGCSFEFDDKIFGKYSKEERQIDIAIRGEIGGNKILGIVDCKYFSKNIDVKIIEGFLGMLDDVKANFGIIITNNGFSKAAKNRAIQKGVKLEIIEFDKINEIQLVYDYFINKDIHNLELSKYEFYQRCTHNSSFFDKEKSNYESRIIIFKEGFANTEYYAYKKLIQESARLFRDFLDLEYITIKIPANDDNQRKKIYSVTIKRIQLELFLELNFKNLREDIRLWRGDFLYNNRFTKEIIYDFARLYIKSDQHYNYADDVS